jgi:hypothetical protein
MLATRMALQSFNGILLVKNGKESMVKNKAENGIIDENSWGCRLAWSRLVASGAIDESSNLSSPILLLETLLNQPFCFHYFHDLLPSS